MKVIFTAVAWAIGVVWSIHYGAGVVTANPIKCFEDWSLASQIVRQEQLTSVEELAGKAKRQFSGAIVRTSLCYEDGHYVYRLLIRDHQGQFSRKDVDARNPF